MENAKLMLFHKMKKTMDVSPQNGQIWSEVTQCCLKKTTLKLVIIS